MTIFWIMTAMATALAGLVVLSGARRGAEAEGAVDREAGARELAELDRLKARGLLDEAGWTAARAEAGRRLLAARRADRRPVARPADRYWVLGGLGLTAAATLGLYVALCAPGLKDQAYETRVREWAATPEALEPAQVAAVLGQVVKDRPDDRLALTMLGAARFEAGDPIGAASAFRRALALQPDDAQSWARLGESLVRANGGAVDGDAEAAFRQAVKLDPDQLGARFYLGDAALARGDRTEAEAMWAPLIAVLDPADPRRADLQRRLAEAAR
ncbi:c-type cytochrome biogenesis protein CcmI [Brevundimonas naejangsanensis]|uniref:C-type cytochrome biogenesis protein CcmI n=1 Tax=Brevundimonas naejangsanensis TaxID=588932 RepID=A0A494RD12_9CAUL|nr:c-type cytochrome biogenesis protein CcmI [Brevundimonas naejangsanensis]AYG94185.1 c-type cytochrome biogenesis protein CcmI [Brevundimonas naejangsanensis]